MNKNRVYTDPTNFKTEGDAKADVSFMSPSRKINTTSYIYSKRNAQDYYYLPSLNSQKGYGMSAIMSASTLQHATPTISFSKLERFPTQKASDISIDNINNISMPSTLGKRSTSLGFGNKVSMAETRNKQAKFNPGPDAHFLNIESKLWTAVNLFRVLELTISKRILVTIKEKLLLEEGGLMTIKN